MRNRIYADNDSDSDMFLIIKELVDRDADYNVIADIIGENENLMKSFLELIQDKEKQKSGRAEKKVAHTSDRTIRPKKDINYFGNVPDQVQGIIYGFS